jgi:hypothetical protein
MSPGKSTGVDLEIRTLRQRQRNYNFVGLALHSAQGQTSRKNFQE